MAYLKCGEHFRESALAFIKAFLVGTTLTARLLSEYQVDAPLPRLAMSNHIPMRMRGIQSWSDYVSATCKVGE
jgi:hypothetical protein